MTLSANPGTMTNLCHCFLATDIEKVDEQHLDLTEDLEVHLLSRQQVYELLLDNKLYQALMYAPLWKYFALEGK